MTYFIQEKVIQMTTNILSEAMKDSLEECAQTSLNCWKKMNKNI